MLNSKKLILPALALTAAYAASGCGMVKNMDEMHDATNHVANTSDHLSSQTDHVADTSDHLARQTDHVAATSDHLADLTGAMHDQTNALYVDQRQGFSDQIRHQFLDALEHQSSMMSKLGEAGQYFMAFEFQLYKHFGSDTEAKLDNLYYQATEEFFRVVRRYINDDRDISVSTSNNDALNAAALAVTMYHVNPNLQNNEAVADEEKISMLELVERALDKKARLESGEVREADLKDWEREVLRNEQDAVYLLQLRTNFIGGIVLADVTDIQDVNIFTKAWRLLFHYDADFSRLVNLEQIATNTDYLANPKSGGIHERDWLRAHNYDPRLDGDLMKLYRHMDIKAQTEAPANAPRNVRLRSNAMKELVKQINEYRK